MALAKNVLRSVIQDARGSVRTVGDLIFVEYALLQLESPDRLARRQAICDLMDRFDWTRTSWFTKNVILTV